MVNTNITTGYTYIPVIVFLQVLPGLKCPIVLAKTLASPGVPVCDCCQSKEAENNNVRQGESQYICSNRFK